MNGGGLVYTLITDASGGSNLRDIATTLLEVFYVVYAFDARTSENTVLVAMKIDVNQLQEDGTRDGKLWPEGPWLAHPIGGRDFQELAWALGDAGGEVLRGLDARLLQIRRVPRGRRVLTDNYAPVD